MIVDHLQTLKQKHDDGSDVTWVAKPPLDIMDKLSLHMPAVLERATLPNVAKIFRASAALATRYYNNDNSVSLGMDTTTMAKLKIEYTHS